jgi:phage replication-related protein YjqB (UPF0714/DUF867 family)
MSKKYTSYKQLSLLETEGVDYTRLWWDRGSRAVVLAPHGGGIEPGTSEIAAAIAGNDFSLYCFEALNGQDSQRMHLASVLFDEPVCLELIRKAHVAVAIHGCADVDPVIYVGGRNKELRNQLVVALQRAGINAKIDDTWHSGEDPANICNQCQSLEGLQLEISLGARKQMFEGMTRAERKKTTSHFWRMIEAVRSVLLE